VREQNGPVASGFDEILFMIHLRPIAFNNRFTTKLTFPDEHGENRRETDGFLRACAKAVAKLMSPTEVWIVRKPLISLILSRFLLDCQWEFLYHNDMSFMEL
jgi:hypothetical protein